MLKPEWQRVAFDLIGDSNTEIYWCKGCGCLKIVHVGRRTRYETPRRERERRIAKKAWGGYNG